MKRSAKLIVTRAEVLPAILMIVATVGVCAFIVFGRTMATRMNGATFDATFQFLLVVVLGSGVSVLFQAMTEIREARERRACLMRDIHLALVAAYNDAKRARRILRARARALSGNEIVVKRAVYDEQLEALSAAQLSIELATRRIEVNRTTVPQADELAGMLKTVAKYLNTIVDEWEDVGKVHPRSALLRMSALPNLEMFLKHWAEAPPFRNGFKVPFDGALRLMEAALAAPA